MAVATGEQSHASVQTMDDDDDDSMGAARYDPDRRGYRIFVGNLAGATSHDDLANLFCPFGPIVDVWLASNPPGFGFVVFKSAMDAERAVTQKNSAVHLGRVIKVSHARLFKDRVAKALALGLKDKTASASSRSRSESRSSSRSRSRSSRSRSRSGSRLSFFSRVYGSSRARSRTTSRSRSRSRSTSSFMTLSAAASSSRSRSRSKSRSRSRTKSRSSRSNRHDRRQSRTKDHQHHRHHRSSRRQHRRQHQHKRRRRHTHTSSGSRSSSKGSNSGNSGSSSRRGGQHELKCGSNGAQPQDDARPCSANRSPVPFTTTSRSHRVRSRRRSQRRPPDECRHCHQCKKRTSSATSSSDGGSRSNSALRASSSSSLDREVSRHTSRKGRKHRRSWRRSGRRSRRGGGEGRESSRSSSPSSSSSSSSLTAPSKKRRRAILIETERVSNKAVGEKTGNAVISENSTMDSSQPATQPAVNKLPPSPRRLFPLISPTPPSPPALPPPPSPPQPAPSPPQVPSRLSRQPSPQQPPSSSSSASSSLLPADDRSRSDSAKPEPKGCSADSSDLNTPVGRWRPGVTDTVVVPPGCAGQREENKGGSGRTDGQGRDTVVRPSEGAVLRKEEDRTLLGRGCRRRVTDAEVRPPGCADQREKDASRDNGGMDGTDGQDTDTVSVAERGERCGDWTTDTMRGENGHKGLSPVSSVARTQIRFSLFRKTPAFVLEMTNPVKDCDPALSPECTPHVSSDGLCSNKIQLPDEKCSTGISPNGHHSGKPHPTVEKCTTKVSQESLTSNETPQYFGEYAQKRSLDVAISDTTLRLTKTRSANIASDGLFCDKRLQRVDNCVKRGHSQGATTDSPPVPNTEHVEEIGTDVDKCCHSNIIEAQDTLLNSSVGRRQGTLFPVPLGPHNTHIISAVAGELNDIEFPVEQTLATSAEETWADKALSHASMKLLKETKDVLLLSRLESTEAPELLAASKPKESKEFLAVFKVDEQINRAKRNSSGDCKTLKSTVSNSGDTCPEPFKGECANIAAADGAMLRKDSQASAEETSPSKAKDLAPVTIVGTSTKNILSQTTNSSDTKSRHVLGLAQSDIASVSGHNQEQSSSKDNMQTSGLNEQPGSRSSDAKREPSHMTKSRIQSPESRSSDDIQSESRDERDGSCFGFITRGSRNTTESRRPDDIKSESRDMKKSRSHTQMESTLGHLKRGISHEEYNRTLRDCGGRQDTTNELVHTKEPKGSVYIKHEHGQMKKPRCSEYTNSDHGHTHEPRSSEYTKSKHGHMKEPRSSEYIKSESGHTKKTKHSGDTKSEPRHTKEPSNSEDTKSESEPRSSLDTKSKHGHTKEARSSEHTKSEPRQTQEPIRSADTKRESGYTKGSKSHEDTKSESGNSKEPRGSEVSHTREKHSPSQDSRDIHATYVARGRIATRANNWTRDRSGDHDRRNGDYDKRNGDYEKRNDAHDRRNGDYDKRNGDYDKRNGAHDRRNGDYNKMNRYYDKRNGDYDKMNGDYDMKNGAFDKRNGLHNNSADQKRIRDPKRPDRSNKDYGGDYGRSRLRDSDPRAGAHGERQEELDRDRFSSAPYRRNRSRSRLEVESLSACDNARKSLPSSCVYVRANERPRADTDRRMDRTTHDTVRHRRSTSQDKRRDRLASQDGRHHRPTSPNTRYNGPTPQNSRHRRTSSHDTRQDKATSQDTRQDKTTSQVTRQDKVTSQDTRQDKATSQDTRQDKATSQDTRQDKVTSQDTARGKAKSQDTKQDKAKSQDKQHC